MSLKAPRDNSDLRTASQAVAEAIRSAGHEPIAAWQEIEEKELSPQQFMPFVREHLRTCDLLFVLYHPELRGGLIELGIAYAYGIPIWLAHLLGQRVSSSVLSCADRILVYSSLEELTDRIREHLSSYVTL